MKHFYVFWKQLRYIFVLFCFLLIGQLSYGQTLAAGDIAFTGYNSNDGGGGTPNIFSFVVLRTGGLVPGTTINFTDNGWNPITNSLGTLEATLTWSTSVTINQFTEVVINIDAAGTGIESVSAGSATAPIGTPSGVFILSQGGDQVLAYQGTSASPTFIAGIHMNSETATGTSSPSAYATWDDLKTGGRPYGSNRSGIPSGLTAGVNAVMVCLNPGVDGTEKDNAVYTCTASTGTTVADLRSKLCNPTNWTTSDPAPVTVPSGCTYGIAAPAPSITGQPSNSTICTGLNTSFGITASNATGYQWQVNTGSGFTNLSNGAPYSNVTTQTLNITGATTALNGYQYRCIASGATAPAATSNFATLTVNPSPSITAQPSASTICAGANTTFSVSADNATGYQWQVNTGSGFTNISNGAPYSGATTATLTITGATSTLNTYQYRAVITGGCSPQATSNAVTLTVNSAPSINSQPSVSTICAGTNTTFTIGASNATGYQWQVDAGGGFTNLSNSAPYSGVEAATLTITGATASMSGYLYRAIITGTCAPAATSNVVTLTVNSAPSISSQPSASTICAGANTTFSVIASNATGYQWQVDAGGGFTNLSNVAPYSGVGTSMLTITGATGALNNYQYRAIVTGACTPAATSNGANLTVNPAPSIGTQPSASTICAGANTTFTVAATNATGYQWQVDAGSGFVNISNGAPYSGATTATLTITGATAGINGYLYRAVVTGGCTPSATSNSAALTVNLAPSIGTQPSASTICAGANTTFTVSAINATGYQWQVDAGSGFVNISNGAPYSGATTATLTITGATAGINGYLYRAVVTGGCAPSATSNSTALTVNSAPSIGTQPTASTICTGANTTFTGTASNATGYQWQVNTGSGFTNVSNGAPYSGATTATLTITGATAVLNSYQYRVVASGACNPNATSNAATLTVNSAPSIGTQPTASTICAGANTTFTVAATNATGYQWQVDAGSGFVNISNGAPYSGATTATLTITGATASINGYLYRAVVTGGCTPSATSNSTALTVNSAPSIGTQPSASTICAGANTTFTGTASNATGYQWQVNTGSGFTNISNGAPYSGATTATLTITGASASLNTYQYRLVVSGACTPNATSNAATLTVNSAPSIGTQPTASTICAGANTTFSATALNATGYQWQVDQGSGFSNISNGAPYSGATTATLTITGATAVLNSYQYRVVASGACNPNATSNVATLTVNSAPSIGTQPTASTICAGANTTFSATALNATGYQWQVNQGSGFSNISNGVPYSGATTATLTITGATAALNTYLYRLVVSGSCTPAATSNGAALTVNSAPSIGTQPSNSAICAGANTNFSVAATNVTTYQWQVNTGSGYANISNDALYSGATTAVLTISGATVGMNGYLYRAIVSGGCSPNATSASASLSINATVSVTTEPTNQSVCEGSDATFTVVASNAAAYQWQVDQGTGFSNISNGTVYSGATSATLTVTNVPASFDGYAYRAVVTGGCASSITSSSASLSLKSNPTVIATPASNTICNGNSTNILLSSSPSGASFAWTVVPVTGSLGGASDGSGTSIQHTLIGEGAIDYIVTPILAGCQGSSTTVSIVVKPLPVATAMPVTATICSGETTNIALTSTPAGAEFAWTIVTTGGTVNGASAGSGTTITQTLSGNGDINYIVFPTLNGCSGSLMTTPVTVKPAPAALPASETICSGATTNIALASLPSGASFDWTVTTASGSVSGASAGNGSAITQTLTGKGVVNYSVTPSLNSCAGTVEIIAVTVNAAPSITTQPLAQTTCIGTGASYNVVAEDATGYLWQVDQGTGFTTISDDATYSGATTSELSVANVTSTMNNYSYRVIVSGICTPNITSDAAELSTEDLTDPVISSCPSDVTITEGVYTYTTPTVTDNCSGATITLTSGLGSGAVFPVGTSVEVYTATDAAGNTSTCTFTITASPATGISENLALAESLEFLPNPASELITVRLKSVANGPLDVEWKDLSGKILQKDELQYNGNDHVLNIAGLPAGIYMVEIRGTNSRTVKKVIVY